VSGVLNRGRRGCPALLRRQRGQGCDIPRQAIAAGRGPCIRDCRRGHVRVSPKRCRWDSGRWSWVQYRCAAGAAHEFGEPVGMRGEGGVDSRG